MALSDACFDFLEAVGRAARELAEELVRGRGWSEKDDDFWYQVEEEAKRLWEEEYERYMFKRGRR